MEDFDSFEPFELFEVSRGSVFFLLLCHRHQFGSVESVLLRTKRTHSSMCQFPGLGSKRLQKSASEATFRQFPSLGSKRLKISLLRLLLDNFQTWAQKGSQ